jgi:hypothetical protein
MVFAVSRSVSEEQSEPVGLDDAAVASALIRRFAAHPLFRSATVDELELDNFYRRPLRPEDLDIIDFSRPVDATRLTHLCSLAAGRILLTINDLGTVRWPRSAEASASGLAQFYSKENLELAAALRPFLEKFALSFLEDARDTDQDRGQCLAYLDHFARDGAAFWRAAIGRLADRGYSDEGLRLILVQHWCLADTKRIALAKAESAGYFDIVPRDLRPRPFVFPGPADEFAPVAARVGMTGNPHRYWQFYLPTSLATVNCLCAMAARPDRALRLLGAGFAAEAEWTAMARSTASAIGLPRDRERQAHAARWADEAELRSRCADALQNIENRCGRRGVGEFAAGLAVFARLARHGWRDLGTQLDWVSSLDRYTEIALLIEQRIRTERPDIDRDTFVEPREMCSTTHVHDDDRLVVVESGRMVFWGNVGMVRRFDPGQMIFVPRGRLHGSSVESELCVYHQPIIPEPWVRQFVEDLDVESIA